MSFEPVVPGTTSLPEVPLLGGRLTAGVVRVGDTVRRPGSEVSGAVRDLLQHLRAVGFDGAPRYLGVDEDGRDVLEFLPGEVPAKIRPLADAQVRAGARLLRRFHDATRGSSLAGDGEVVCHHDAGPNNAVFRDDLPVAFIDFDMVRPGDPLEDLGYMGWLWCISSKATAPDPMVQAHQLTLLAESYGLDWGRRAHLVDAILDRQYGNADFWRERERHGSTPTLRVTKIAEIIEWTLREAEFTESHRPLFELALGMGPTSSFVHAG